MTDRPLSASGARPFDHRPEPLTKTISSLKPAR